MFSPQLLQSSAVFGSATAYKDETRWRPEMGDVFNWMLDRVDERTIVAATDGRNPKIRFQLQSMLYEQVKDDTKHLDNYIMYTGKPSKGDIRFPSRKVYSALNNVEGVVGSIPVSLGANEDAGAQQLFSLRRNLYAYKNLFWSVLAQPGRPAAHDIEYEGKLNRSPSSHLRRRGNQRVQGKGPSITLEGDTGHGVVHRLLPRLPRYTRF